MGRGWKPVLPVLQLQRALQGFPPRPVEPALHFGHVVVVVVVVVVVGRQHPEHHRGKVTGGSPSIVRVIQWIPV